MKLYAPTGLRKGVPQRLKRLLKESPHGEKTYLSG